MANKWESRKGVERSCREGAWSVWGTGHLESGERRGEYQKVRSDGQWEAR